MEGCDDKNLLQAVNGGSGTKVGIFCNTRVGKACVCHIAQNQVPGVHRRTGGDNPIVITDHGGGGQIFHHQHTGVIGGVSTVSVFACALQIDFFALKVLDDVCVEIEIQFIIEV